MFISPSADAEGLFWIKIYRIVGLVGLQLIVSVS
jgi:hypothetical protein